MTGSEKRCLAKNLQLLIERSPGSKSAVIALIAGSTTKGIRNRKAKTERIAVVPENEKKAQTTVVLDVKFQLTQTNRCVPLCLLQIGSNDFLACQRSFR